MSGSRHCVTLDDLICFYRMMKNLEIFISTGNYEKMQDNITSYLTNINHSPVYLELEL